jgi:hypothetical protein
MSAFVALLGAPVAVVPLGVVEGLVRFGVLTRQTSFRPAVPRGWVPSSSSC